MEDSNTRKRILNSSKDLFQKFGIRSITMDDIAHNLGISKKTIYQHFSDKDDIVTLSIRNYAAKEKSELLEIKDNARDAVELLVAVSRYVQKDLSHNTSALLFDLQKYHPKAWSIITDFKHGFLTDFVMEILRAGIEQGLFRNDMDVEVIARIRLEEVTLAHSESVFPAGRFGHVNVSKALLEHFIHAICTEKGKKRYKKLKDVNFNNKGIQHDYEV